MKKNKLFQFLSYYLHAMFTTVGYRKPTKEGKSRRAADKRHNPFSLYSPPTFTKAGVDHEVNTALYYWISNGDVPYNENNLRDDLNTEVLKEFARIFARNIVAAHRAVIEEDREKAFVLWCAGKHELNTEKAITPWGGRPLIVAQKGISDAANEFIEADAALRKEAMLLLAKAPGLDTNEAQRLFNLLILPLIKTIELYARAYERGIIGAIFLKKRFGGTNDFNGDPLLEGGEYDESVEETIGGERSFDIAKDFIINKMKLYASQYKQHPGFCPLFNPLFLSIPLHEYGSIGNLPRASYLLNRKILAQLMNKNDDGQFGAMKGQAASMETELAPAPLQYKTKRRMRALKKDAPDPNNMQ
jgi:hypothetical protein